MRLRGCRAVPRDELMRCDESEGMPGLTFGVAMTALGLAAVAVGPRRELDE